MRSAGATVKNLERAEWSGGAAWEMEERPTRASRKRESREPRERKRALRREIETRRGEHKDLQDRSF